MSSKNRLFKTKLDVYLGLLARNYERQNNDILLKIIVNACDTRLEEDVDYYEDYGKSMHGHALNFTLPSELYINIAGHKEDYLNDIRTDINKICDLHEEYISDVFFEIQQEENFQNWKDRYNAQKIYPYIVSEPVQTKLWEIGKFRLFLSHKTEEKINVSQLKKQLKLYGIDCFIAHEDIPPTEEWQEEIKNALFSSDALVALMTDKFHDSDWTDQEIGCAFGRGIPIVSVRLGKDPYGFIGKFQALSSTWENLPSKLPEILIKYEKMKYSYILAIKECSSYSEGKRLAELLPYIDSFNAEQEEQIILAYNGNSQIYDNFSFNGGDRGQYVSFKNHLNRITGHDYVYNMKKLINT